MEGEERDRVGDERVDLSGLDPAGRDEGGDALAPSRRSINATRRDCSTSIYHSLAISPFTDATLGLL